MFYFLCYILSLCRNRRYFSDSSFPTVSFPSTPLFSACALDGGGGGGF